MSRQVYAAAESDRVEVACESRTLAMQRTCRCSEREIASALRDAARKILSNGPGRWRLVLTLNIREKGRPRRARRTRAASGAEPKTASQGKLFR
jgi:hypothetical protein